MEKYGKAENPIVIKLSHLGNIILPFNGIDQEYPLDPGLVLKEGSNHYGFMIIVDHNNKQSESVFRTDHEICGLCIIGNTLQILEREVLKPWRFNLDGKIIEDNYATVDFTQQIEEYLIDGEIRKMSPETIELVIEKNSRDNHIEFKGKKYPLNPGLTVGNEIYGIVIKDLINEEVKKIATEGTIYGVEPYREIKNGFAIYEDGKYHPWKIDGKGNIVEEAQFNPYSRRDQEYYFTKYHKELTLKPNKKI